MIKEISYTNIKEALRRILKHPLLQEVTLEQAIQYTIDFISIFGMPRLFQDKEAEIKITDFRAELPEDLISINHIKEVNSNIPLRIMSGAFNPTENNYTYKTQGNIIYTSIKDGDLLVSYKSIPVDKDGYPMLIDNPVFLKALELYIKKEVFTILFDMGKISPAVLQHTEQQYSWLAGQLQAEFTIPSIAEMESIKNNWCSLIQRTKEFDNNFTYLGNK